MVPALPACPVMALTVQTWTNVIWPILAMLLLPVTIQSRASGADPVLRVILVVMASVGLVLILLLGKIIHRS